MKKLHYVRVSTRALDQARQIAAAADMKSVVWPSLDEQHHHQCLVGVADPHEWALLRLACGVARER